MADTKLMRHELLLAAQGCRDWEHRDAYAWACGAGEEPLDLEAAIDALAKGEITLYDC